MAEQGLTEYLRRQRRVNNTWPLDGGSDPVVEGSSAPYHWQPETLWYRDTETGNEVCMLVYPHKVQSLISTEYASRCWSADGQRIGFFFLNSGASLSNREASHNALAFSGGSSYRRFVINSDGSGMRTQYGSKGHGDFGDGDFGWMRSPANAGHYLAFVSHAVTEGGSVYELWDMSLDSNNVPTATLRLNTKTATGGDDSKSTILSTALGKIKTKRSLTHDDAYLLALSAAPDDHGRHTPTEGVMLIRTSDWSISRYWGLARGITATYGNHVGPLLTNSRFATDLTGWTDASTGGGSVVSSGGRLVLTGGGGTAILRQSFTSPAFLATLQASISIPVITGGGTVTLKVGSTLGGTQYFSKAMTTAKTYSHGIDGGMLAAAIPAGATVYVQLEYTGGTSAAVSVIGIDNEYKHHGGGLWLLDENYMICQYTNSDLCFWRFKLSGSDTDGGPKWEPYANMDYGNNEVIPFSLSPGSAPRQIHSTYWGHPAFSPRGDYMVFGEVEDTDGYVPGPRVVRVSDGAQLNAVSRGNLSKSLMPSNNDYDGRHHYWDAWTDHVGFFSNYVNQRLVHYRTLYTRELNLQTGNMGPYNPVAGTYGIWILGGGTTYTAYTRPVFSPDGTKILFGTCFPMQLTPLNNLIGASFGDWTNQSSGTGSVSVSGGIATLTAGASGTAAIEFLATIPQKASSPFATYLVELHLENGSAPTLIVGTTSGGTDLVSGTVFTSVDGLGYAGHVEGYRAAPAAFGAAANNITQAYFRIRLTTGSCQISGIRIYNTTHLGLAYAVAYYPKPPVLAGASKVSTNVRLAWSPQSYNPTTGNDTPRETKGYHVWSTSDATLLSGWTELTTSAQAGLTYDHAQANGTTLFYAVTTEEHSRLESDYLSNVWRVVLDGGGTITSQQQIREEGLRGWWVMSPSAPTLASSTFPPSATNSISWTPPGDVSKVRYYNLYYSPSGPPSTTVDNRIASIPVGVNAWIDWLHDTASTANYAITSVDRYGNESGMARVDRTSSRDRHMPKPYIAQERPAMTEALRVPKSF